jgi:type II secretory ATPase GspE/PulE/Tfp pilus assembly ATPase PilB-like protein
MNIAEKRIPQDGHVELKREQMDIDLRISTFPTIWGEKIVIRILNRAGVNLGLKELGFEPETLDLFQKVLRQPHGLVLTTGPTGSGKTTTLYSALNTVNTLQRNIITLEDPVEYRLPVVNQGQVNPTAGLSFATGLRSILRQDPDIIMVGEIRDLETAQLAVQAALTGHLVFSSLHTNDAPSTATRLVDMGLEPYLVASTLVCAIGQRLVRLLCPRCREPYQATQEEKTAFGLDPSKEYTFYQPNGCKYCSKMGYLGRTGLFELMTLDENIRRLIVEKKPTSFIRQTAITQGMKTLRQVGLAKVLSGLTSVPEILRVTVDEELAT